MHLSAFVVVVVLLLGPVGAALTGQGYCARVQSEIARASAGRRATTFCASFLHVHTATTTTTHTTASVRTKTATVTGAGTGPTTTPTVTTTVRSTTFVTDGCPTTTAVVPRQVAGRDLRLRDVHARPVATPACFTSLAGAEISRACHCLRIPTPTSTVTVCAPARTTTVTTTVHPTTTFAAPTETTTATSIRTVPLCACDGLDGVAYQGTFDQLPADQDYAAYRPEAWDFPGNGTSFGGTARALNGGTVARPDMTFFYGNSFADAHGSDANRSMLLNDRFYFRAPVTGQYTFAIPDPNTLAFLWVGPNAYRGWTRANADLVQPRDQPVTSSTVSLTAGSYTPVRLFYAHAPLDYGVFGLRVRDPDGVPLISVPVNRADPFDAPATPYVVQYSCDPADRAPPFPEDLGDG